MFDVRESTLADSQNALEAFCTVVDYGVHRRSRILSYTNEPMVLIKMSVLTRGFLRLRRAVCGQCRRHHSDYFWVWEELHTSLLEPHVLRMEPATYNTTFRCVHDATPCQATTRSGNSYHEWWSGRKHAVYLDQTILLGDRPLSPWKTTPSPMSPVPTIRMTFEQLLMEAIRNHNGARQTTGMQP